MCYPCRHPKEQCSTRAPRKYRGSIVQHCPPPERKVQCGSMAPSAHHMRGALVPLHSRLCLYTDQKSFYKIKKRTEGRHQKLDKISLNSPEQSTTATNETRSGGQWGGNMDTEFSALPYTSFLDYTLWEEFQSNDTYAPMLFLKNQSFSVFLQSFQHTPIPKYQ